MIVISFHSGVVAIARAGSGKSLLLNILLEADVLPSMARACTSVVTQVFASRHKTLTTTDHNDKYECCHLGRRKGGGHSGSTRCPGSTLCHCDVLGALPLVAVSQCDVVQLCM